MPERQLVYDGTADLRHCLRHLLGRDHLPVRLEVPIDHRVNFRTQHGRFIVDHNGNRIVSNSRYGLRNSSLFNIGGWHFPPCDWHICLSLLRGGCLGIGTARKRSGGDCNENTHEKSVGAHSLSLNIWFVYVSLLNEPLIFHYFRPQVKLLICNFYFDRQKDSPFVDRRILRFDLETL